MGATIVHGIRLRKTNATLPDGSVFAEIIPVEGDYDFPSYSSVRDLVNYACSRGIDPALWPLYYDVPHSEIELNEVRGRCHLLKTALSHLSDCDINGNQLLRRVIAWLSSGETFCITE